VLVLQGISQLDDPEHQRDDNRHHERELDHALAARIGKPAKASL
jgi:hypothetical protein